MIGLSFRSGNNNGKVKLSSFPCAEVETIENMYFSFSSINFVPNLAYTKVATNIRNKVLQNRTGRLVVPVCDIVSLLSAIQEDTFKSYFSAEYVNVKTYEVWWW